MSWRSGRVRPAREPRLLPHMFIVSSGGGGVNPNLSCLRHAIFIGPPLGRHPADRSACTPAGPHGRSVFRTKNIWLLRHRAANPVRARPWPERRRRGGGRTTAAVIPCRAARPPRRFARRCPQAADAVFFRKRCRPGRRSMAERRPRFQEELPGEPPSRSACHAFRGRRGRCGRTRQLCLRRPGGCDLRSRRPPPGLEGAARPAVRPAGRWFRDCGTSSLR